MLYRTSLRAQRTLIAGCHLLTLLLLGLHLAVLQMPPTLTPIPEPGDAEAAWWGFWPVTYLPSWLSWACAILLVVGMLLWWLREWFRRQETLIPAQNRLSLQMSFFLLTLIMIFGFYFLPVAHTRWGDADILSRAIAWPNPDLRLTHSWQAPLDVWIHSQLWLAFYDIAGWENATPVYRILSPIAGVLYLMVALGLSRFLWPTVDWFTFGLLASLGVVQLFFGYVENYSFAAAGILGYLWLGLRLLRGLGKLWMPSLLLGITIVTHPSTAVLLPSLLYLGKCQMSGPKGISVLRAFAQLVLPGMLMLALTVGMMEAGGHGIAALLTTDRPGGGDARWFVPLFETSTRWEHYTLFSWLHLRDFLNEQILVAPVVLPSLLMVGMATILIRRNRSRSASSELDMSTLGPSYTLLLSVAQERRFLTVATLCYLALTLIWNPDYGGQRDWDLFSLAALPTTLLLAWTLPTLFSLYRYFVAAALPLVIVQALHTLAWIYQNTLPWTWPE